MERLTYQVEDSTLAEVLGVSSFTNAESAVLEIVKNAYDAGSPDLTIAFEGDCIVFSDHGKGMSADDIKTYWMHVGKTSKGYSDLDADGGIRVQAGSKGVGRFALARLGAQVTMTSKKAGSKGVIWQTDWISSTLDSQPQRSQGTQIVISQLRDRWTKKTIESLRGFLSKTYNDDAMEIKLASGDSSPAKVYRYFDEPKLGVNCTEIVRFSFDADSLSICVKIESDEFLPTVQDLVTGVDTTCAASSYDALAELSNCFDDDLPATDRVELLKSVGSFDSELYFSLSGVTGAQADAYRYKYRTLADKYNAGVILYRNAFSISSFEGSKDWIGLDARVRKSPAGAAHRTGSWRVRANQLAGFVMIDKERNPALRDLANRQGLEENIQFELFISIIDVALRAFERYRQSIMRAISDANVAIKDASKPDETVSGAIASGKLRRNDISSAVFSSLRKELKAQQALERERRKEVEGLEEHYKYEARILNVLATSGLKASSIAHQLKNDENNILNNSKFVRDALKMYGLWDVASAEENTRIAWRSIPDLLNRGERINGKIAAFMSAMLSDIERDRFLQATCDLNQALERIAAVWGRDYAQANISLWLEKHFLLGMPEDTIQVIFDNLILNSLQQNERAPSVSINIMVKSEDDHIVVTYSDDGAGLHGRYHEDPRRILEVHETTREKGHGLGMWIVNNSLLSYHCEVVEIGVSEGFSIVFTLKG